MDENIYDECMLILDRFMAALNAHDAAAMDREMHFAHVRIAKDGVVVYPRPGSNPMDLFDKLRSDDDWKYSRWERRELIQFDARKAHFILSYTRFRSDDSVIGTYESLYILTKVEGRWGVQVRSSFGP